MGKLYNISGPEIIWEHPEWIYKYKIQVSADNITWVMVSDKTANTYFGAPSEVNNFLSSGYRYIRITVTGWGNGGYWASLYEFKVFGTLSTTGTNESQNSVVKIYPNPTTDYLSIENIKPNADVTV